MNISKYDFHDGCLININHFDNKIELSMESAEITDEELNHKIVLSKNNTIIGKLHLEEIKSIKVNERSSKILIQEYDVGNIFAFDIEGNKMTLIVGWEDRLPKTCRTDFWKIEVIANRIYWENIPDLPNLFR